MQQRRKRKNQTAALQRISDSCFSDTAKKTFAGITFVKSDTIYVFRETD
jgi:hypothetical protein